MILNLRPFWLPWSLPLLLSHLSMTLTPVTSLLLDQSSFEAKKRFPLCSSLSFVRLGHVCYEMGPTIVWVHSRSAICHIYVSNSNDRLILIHLSSDYWITLARWPAELRGREGAMSPSQRREMTGSTGAQASDLGLR